jgi:hypothetical protein
MNRSSRSSRRIACVFAKMAGAVLRRLPATTVVGAFLRSRRGATIIAVSKQGLTSFGQGLDDAEVRYLHAVVQRALVE